MSNNDKNICKVEVEHTVKVETGTMLLGGLALLGGAAIIVLGGGITVATGALAVGAKMLSGK